MNRLNYLALLVAGSLNLAVAANSIGQANANGSFRVDNASIWGNATLFNGNVVETNRAVSQLSLNDGTNVRLSSDSRAEVYQNRLQLDKGTSELKFAGAYEVDARTLRITPGAPGTVAQIQLPAGKKVEVAALGGEVRVTNASGVLVAQVAPGQALEFEPPAAGASAATVVVGKMFRRGDRLGLVDETTNVTLEIQGEDLEKEIGKRVQATGVETGAAPGIPGATGVLRVTEVKRLSGRAAARTAAGEQTAEPADASTGGGATAGSTAGTAAAVSVKTIAIIGGVAVAGAAGGLYAAHAFPGQDEQPAPASR